jgi:hypothetical protein
MNLHKMMMENQWICRSEWMRTSTSSRWRTSGSGGPRAVHDEWTRHMLM